jgi:hypothetical protein
MPDVRLLIRFVVYVQVLEPSQREQQNAHYYGWSHAVYVTGTLCFSADGLIVWCKHNCWAVGMMQIRVCSFKICYETQA